MAPCGEQAKPSRAAGVNCGDVPTGGFAVVLGDGQAAPTVDGLGVLTVDVQAVPTADGLGVLPVDGCAVMPVDGQAAVPTTDRLGVVLPADGLAVMLVDGLGVLPVDGYAVMLGDGQAVRLAAATATPSGVTILLIPQPVSAIEAERAAMPIMRVFPI
jgi:hypothetical protein